MWFWVLATSASTRAIWRNSVSLCTSWSCASRICSWVRLADRPATTSKASPSVNPPVTVPLSTHIETFFRHASHDIDAPRMANTAAVGTAMMVSLHQPKAPRTGVK